MGCRVSSCILHSSTYHTLNTTRQFARGVVLAWVFPCTNTGITPVIEVFLVGQIVKIIVRKANMIGLINKQKIRLLVPGVRVEVRIVALSIQVIRTMGAQGQS